MPPDQGRESILVTLGEETFQQLAVRQVRTALEQRGTAQMVDKGIHRTSLP
jgi:hypothetical protein